jgi:cytochrome c-type biogenesis protein CcmH/NrfG
MAVFPLLILQSCIMQEERAAVRSAQKLLGRHDKTEEELERARGRLRRVIETKTRAVELLEEIDRYLGARYLEMGSYHLAEEALLEAERLKPASPFVKKDLGECYYYLAVSAMEPSESERLLSVSRGYFEKSIELEPDYLEARYGLGLVLFFGFDDVDGAIEQMKQVVSEQPDDVDARFALGRFHYEKGDLGKAMSEYLEITRILPKNSPRREKAEENIVQINRELGLE